MLAESTIALLEADSDYLPSESQRAYVRLRIHQSIATRCPPYPSRRTDWRHLDAHPQRPRQASGGLCPELARAPILDRCPTDRMDRREQVPQQANRSSPTDTSSHPYLVLRTATPTRVEGVCRPRPHKLAHLQEIST